MGDLGSEVAEEDEASKERQNEKLDRLAPAERTASELRQRAALELRKHSKSGATKVKATVAERSPSEFRAQAALELQKRSKPSSTKATKAVL